MTEPRFADSFNGLEEAWSAKARLAALEARRGHAHPHVGGSITRGVGSSLDRLTRMPTSGLDDPLHSKPKTDADLFPGEAAYRARHAASAPIPGHTAGDYRPPVVNVHRGVPIHEDPTTGEHYAAVHELGERKLLVHQNLYEVHRKIDHHIERQRRFNSDD